MDETGDLDLRFEHLVGVEGGALLRLSGKGGHAIVRKLQDLIPPLLANGMKIFLFDCAGLEFFNSLAFGYLTNLSDGLREAGGRVALCRVPMKVRVAFEYMGLKDFFEFFKDESEAIRSFQDRAALEDPVLPEDEADPSPFSIALPSWLEDVDKPGPPPLDHLRWSALLQVVLRKLGPEFLAELPKRANVPPDSPPSLFARAILRGLRSPEELLNLFDEDLLIKICRLFELPESGSREDRSQALIDFVLRTNTVTLAQFMEESPPAPELEPAPTPATAEKALEITGETLLKAIERCAFPKRVKSERSGRDLLFKHLAKTFGRAQITPDRTLGRHLTLKADLDVMGRFGILVRLGKSLLGKKASALKNVESLIGKAAVLAGIYGRGNLFILLLGEIPRKTAPAMSELRSWIESAGGRTFQR